MEFLKSCANGTPTPSPGSGGTPGPGTPTAGPGNGPSSHATDVPPRDPAALDRQITQLDQQVARLLQEAGENPTAAQALQILQILAERNRLTSLRDGLANGGDPNDY